MVFYYRSFRLGSTADYNSVSSSLENGVLTITMPKRPEVKPKTVLVKVS